MNSTTSVDYRAAQSILGEDFITAEEIRAVRRGVVYSPKKIVQLAETIPSEEILCSLKANGYALMPQPPKPLALLAIRELKPNHFYPKTGDWYEDRTFAKDVLTDTGWLAIKKTPIDNSMSKNLCRQKKLLLDTEFVPNVAETSWFVSVFFDVRGVKLLGKYYVRTSSGYRVRFGNRGISIKMDWSSSSSTNLMLAAAWKL